MKRTHVSVIDIQHTHTHTHTHVEFTHRIGSMMPDMFHTNVDIPWMSACGWESRGSTTSSSVNRAVGE